MSSTPTPRSATREFTVRLPEDTARALKTFGFLTDTTVTEVFRLAVIDYLRAHDHDERVAARAKAALEYTLARDKLATL